MHDYARSVQRKKQHQKKKPQKASLPKWLIPLTLLLVCALVFGLYKLTNIPPINLPQKKEASTTKKEPLKKAPQKAQTIKEDYDFYNLLPESEVIAPKVEEYSSEKAGDAARYAYLLQAGSFRSAAEADKLRAKLLLEGLLVNTSKVTNQNGDIWHRVMVGPFTSRSKLNRAQDILANNNTDSMLIKIKQ